MAAPWPGMPAWMALMELAARRPNAACRFWVARSLASLVRPGGNWAAETPEPDSPGSCLMDGSVLTTPGPLGSAMPPGGRCWGGSGTCEYCCCGGCAGAATDDGGATAAAAEADADADAPGGPDDGSFLGSHGKPATSSCVSFRCHPWEAERNG